MKNDLISREALAWEYLKLILNHSMDTDIFDFGLAVTNAIETAPAVNAVEVVHAKWKLNNDGSGTCGNCHRTTVAVWDMDSSLNYCPHCGAIMDGDG